MTNSKPFFWRWLTRPQTWGYGLFWSWNIIFLAFMLLGFAPQVLPPMLTAVQSGDIPQDFLVYAVVLTLIPVIVVILGATVLRRDPGGLFALGYGAEGPLMLLLAIRFFAVRELTPAPGVLLGIAGLGLLAFLWQLLDRAIDARPGALRVARGIGLTLLVLTGLYAAVWAAFYAVPLAAWGGTVIAETLRNFSTFIRNLLSDLSRLELRWLPFSVLGFALMAYTATLFVLMPVAVPVLYFQAWRRAARNFAGAHGWPRFAALAAAAIGVSLVLVAATLPQPQRQAFALVRQKPANLDEAKALLQRESEIRAGLLNAYLAPFRYISALGEVTHVRELYRSVVGLSDADAANVQRLYEAVARPVLYEPVDGPATAPYQADQWALRREPQEAAELYERYFDRPLVEAEREAVAQAARSTWSPDRARAAWQAVDDREIHLQRQEVRVTERGDWAEVELYEVYQNRTAQRQEVVYYFSLPESAVITGVWLGNSAERSERFKFHVAPRGAAQAVYQSQVQIRLDPALVEQIGPRQYRLRAFPVEPQSVQWDSGLNTGSVQPGPELHLWLTWRVLADGDAWPMPRLAEKRNVYWDTATARSVNGQPMAGESEAWLPETVPASAPVTPAAHRVDFPGGVSVVARPAGPGDRPAPASGLRLAVVLDRSRSMANHAAAAAAALDELRALDAAVDVYLTASEFRGEAASRVTLAAVTPESLLPFGGQNAAEMLAQFEALRAGAAYDFILVLTDGSGYELGPSPVAIAAPDTPVWMVHLGGDYPIGYDDATLEAIQASGGGAAGSVAEALERGLTARAGGGPADLIDGYIWASTPTADAPNLPADADFAPLAARRLILAELPDPQRAAERLETLDRLHAIAQDAGIVTPYSSMLVLVNEAQEAQLRRLAQGADRFEREFEAVGETAPNLNVTGVPEPEEWLLIALAGALLAAYVYRNRGTWRPAR